jgi:hypothetical protein
MLQLVVLNTCVWSSQKWFNFIFRDENHTNKSRHALFLGRCRSGRASKHSVLLQLWFRENDVTLSISGVAEEGGTDFKGRQSECSKLEVKIFILAPCILKSTLFTHQQMHYLLNLKGLKFTLEFTQISLLHVSVFDHHQGACTEPG